MQKNIISLFILIWRLFCNLPLFFQSICAYLLSLIFLLFPNKRSKISKKNIELCFEKEFAKSIYKKNIYQSTKSIFYTGIAWFWTNEKISKKIKYQINGLDKLKDLQRKNIGVLLFFKHSLHLELDARVLGMNLEVYGVQRNHNSELFNKFQDMGRKKSIKDTADKNNPRKFIKWLKDGKCVLYANDQDYGQKKSDIINFFNHPAATISAPYKILQTTNSTPFFMNTYFENNKLYIQIEEITMDGITSAVHFSSRLNNIVENSIKKHPHEYLWQHRRFKSTLGKEFYK